MKTRSIGLITAAVATGLAGNAWTAGNSPGTFIVNTTADTVDAAPGNGHCADADGFCSLRAAVQEANASGSHSTIELQRRIYRLSIPGASEDGAATGDLDVGTAISINGNDAVIDANSLDRAFDVFAPGSLNLTYARIINGAAPETQSGGAIQSNGDTTLFEVDLVGNTVFGAGASGGALFNNGGTLRVIDSTLRNNSSTRAGGAIEALAGSTILEDTNLAENTTGPMPGNGGGFHLTGAGTVRVEGGVVRGNTATSEGGGLWNSVAGTMRVIDVVLTDNTATGDAADNGGGALFNDGGLMTVDRTTIANNVASGSAGSGGGILNNAGRLTVTDSILQGNTATRAGGGIESNLGNNFLRRTNLIGNVTGNSPGNGGGLHITGAGNVKIAGGLIKGNSAAAEGGGLWNGSALMVVSGARVIGNTASGTGADQGGGGLFNNGGRLIVVNSTVDGNVANAGSGSGGGILNDQGTLTVRGTNIVGNSALRAGGGIESKAGSTELLDVLLFDNQTGAAPGNGGGLHLSGTGTVEISESAVFNNDASNEGGGLWNSSTGTMGVTGTDIGDNTSPDGPDVFNDGGTFTIDGVPVPAS